MARTVGERIEEIAAAKGLPAAAALAELLGVRYESLRKWRTGDAAPNRSRQKVIAKVLGVPEAAFMHGVDAAKAAPAADPWPFERITAEQWAALSARQQGAIEDAAVQKLRELGAEAKDDAPRFARALPESPSRKRLAAGK